MSTSNPPQTLPAALAALDHILAANAGLRSKLADVKAECDNVYRFMVAASTQASGLATELAHAHAEREQLRESLESTTALVEELTAERSALRRRCEELSTERDTWRGAASAP